MRLVISVIMAMMLALPQAMAVEPYFCVRQGAELHYVRSSVTDGGIVWKHTMSIDAVTERGGVRTVSYSSLFTKANGSRMYGGPVRLSVSIDPNGDVKMNVAQSLAAVIGNILGNRNVKQEGGVTVLPSGMKPGDRLADASGTASVGPAKISATVTERVVLGNETLTTPAGVFECIVIQEHKVEKGLRNRVTTAKTWYARGVGMVRHDTYDRNMKMETSELLQSVK